MKIKIKEITKGCKFEVIPQGDWIDLKNAKTFTVRGVTAVSGVKYIPLGIAMELPKGYEAILLPRSSTPRKYNVICANSMGVIDNSYSGDGDEWQFPVVATKNTRIPAGTRICQFRIQLSQKATKWQKLKWLFNSKIEFEWVESLENTDRGGLGSTDTNN